MLLENQPSPTKIVNTKEKMADKDKEMNSQKDYYSIKKKNEDLQELPNIIFKGEETFGK